MGFFGVFLCFFLGEGWGAGLRLGGKCDGMGQEEEGSEEKAAFQLSEGGGEGQPREYFLSSDASAVVEHTKKVLVIEDNEVVHIRVPACPLPPPPHKNPKKSTKKKPKVTKNQP